MSEKVCQEPTLPDEVLYGRAGYLYSLLYVQHVLGHDKIKNETINQVHLLFVLVYMTKHSFSQASLRIEY